MTRYRTEEWAFTGRMPVRRRTQPQNHLISLT